MQVLHNFMRCQSVGNFNFHSIAPGLSSLLCNSSLEKKYIFNFVKVELE